MSADKQHARLVQLAKMAKLTLAKSGSNDVLTFMHKELSQGRVSSLDGLIEEALCYHGRVYRRELPAKIRRGPMGRCFLNAFGAADGGEGTYVEGFALTSGRLVHHAWITRDGVGAVEVTWKKDTSASYFGIPFPHEKLIKIVSKTQVAQVFGDDRSLPLGDILQFL